MDGAVEFVEAADAAETARQRDLGQRQAAFVDQRVCRGEALRLGDGDRRRAEMLAEQAADLPLTEAEPVAERVDLRLIQPAAVDQVERPADARRRAVPRRAARGRVGAAPLAGAVTGGDSLGGGRDEGDVPEQRRPRRAYRAAEDTGRADTGEERAVGTRIAGDDRGVAGGGVEGGGVRHVADIRRCAAVVWRFSDVAVVTSLLHAPPTPLRRGPNASKPDIASPP